MSRTRGSLPKSRTSAVARCLKVRSAALRVFVQGLFGSGVNAAADVTTERSRHLMERPRREHERGACPVDFLTHLPARLPIDIEVLERERECPVDMPVADVILPQDRPEEQTSELPPLI